MLSRIEDTFKFLIGGYLLFDTYYRTFGLNGNETVLDFGCGGGTGAVGLVKLLNNNGRIICLDSSTHWINKARKRLGKYNNAECQLGKINEVSIPDNSIDVVTTIYVIHDIKPDERFKTIIGLFSKLKPNGRFFIKEPVKETHGIPANEIRELLTQAGFQEIRYKTTKSEYTGEHVKPSE